MTDQDPLRDLLVDATEVNRQAIVQVLKGRVSIDSATGRPVLMPGYAELDARRKVLVILLATKAAHLLELAESEFLTAAQVIEESGLPGGTAHPSLKSLRELRLVGQDGSKAYHVPNPQLNNVLSFITSQRI